MKVNQIRDLAIKILGVYYLANGIMSLSYILSMLAHADQEPIGGRVMFFLCFHLSTIVSLVIGFVLAFRSRLVMSWLWCGAEEEAETTAISLPLATWVSLIGLFYLVSALPDVASRLGAFGMEWDKWRSVVQSGFFRDFLTLGFFKDLIALMLAVVCIVKARPIAEYLKKKTE